MNPSTADLVEAVRRDRLRIRWCSCEQQEHSTVAEQVDALVDQTVTVVPTNSIVEGFAALLEYDPDATAA